MKFMLFLKAFALKLRSRLLPTFDKQSGVEKFLSAIMLFVGKPSNSLIHNSGITGALVSSFLLANSYSRPHWVLIPSAAVKQKSSNIFRLSLECSSGCCIVSLYFVEVSVELFIRSWYKVGWMSSRSFWLLFSVQFKNGNVTWWLKKAKTSSSVINNSCSIWKPNRASTFNNNFLPLKNELKFWVNI